jgi:RNA polymerase sigma-70 factor (ECF subfamily)
LHPIGEDDRALVRRALDGDPSAAKILVRRLMPIVHARVGWFLTKARGRSPSPSDHEDLTQEIWLQLMKDNGHRLRAFDPARGATLEGFVGTIAHNEAAKKLEYETREKRGGKSAQVDAESLERVAATDGTPEETALANDLAARLKEHVLGTFPERGRLVYLYLFVDGHPPEEVARILSVSTQVIHNWQHKIRNAARTFLSARNSAST